MTYLPPEQSLKMTGLVLASYRTDSIPCSQTTCVVTAAHACTSPQPTMSSGPWVLESAWDRSHTSTAYPWLKEPRLRACEHSTRWEDGKTELTISSMGRWQGGTWKSIYKLQQGLVHDNAGPILANEPASHARLQPESVLVTHLSFAAGVASRAK